MRGREWLNSVLTRLKIGRKWRRKIVRLIFGSFNSSARVRLTEIDKQLGVLYYQFVKCDGSDRVVKDLYNQIRVLEDEHDRLWRQINE